MSDVSNLPVAVERVGGALEHVVRDIESYTHSQYPLVRRGQIALARLVEKHPSFNTEQRISLLVDAFAYHGVANGGMLDQLLQEYGVEKVHLAVDYLYEVGQRDRGNESRDSLSDMKKIRRVLELRDKLEALHYEVSTTEQLDMLIHELRGLNVAVNLDDEQILDALEGDGENAG